MTAQHPNDENLDQHPADLTDPIGPARLPLRGKLGKRAMALVGTTSMAALAVHAFIDGCSTDTTQEHFS
jgi:hypothetical protein